MKIKCEDNFFLSFMPKQGRNKAYCTLYFGEYVVDWKQDCQDDCYRDDDMQFASPYSASSEMLNMIKKSNVEDALDVYKDDNCSEHYEDEEIIDLFFAAYKPTKRDKLKKFKQVVVYE